MRTNRKGSNKMENGLTLRSERFTALAVAATSSEDVDGWPSGEGNETKRLKTLSKTSPVGINDIPRL
jgi:hypothetical protein